MNPVAKVVIIVSMSMFCALLSFCLYGVSTIMNFSKYMASDTRDRIDTVFWILCVFLFERTISSGLSCTYRLVFAVLKRDNVNNEFNYSFYSINKTSWGFRIFISIYFIIVCGLATAFIITYGNIGISSMTSDELIVVNLLLEIFMAGLCSIFVQVIVIFGGIYLERRYIIKHLIWPLNEILTPSTGQEPNTSNLV